MQRHKIVHLGPTRTFNLQQGRREARTRTRLQAVLLLAVAAFVRAKSCAAPHANAAPAAAAADRF